MDQKEVVPRRGAGLSDIEEQLGTQRPTGTPGPRHPTRAEPAHLDPIQQLAHAPKAVGFDAPQNVLRQVGHVKVLDILFCKTKGEESPEVFSRKWREKDRV